MPRTRGGLYLRPVHRLAAVAWLLKNAPADAERVLRYTDAASVDADVINGLQPVLSLSFLQRARAAEADGRPEDAADFHIRFLMTYAMPTKHEHLCDEARALARLTGGDIRSLAQPSRCCQQRYANRVSIPCAGDARVA